MTDREKADVLVVEDEPDVNDLVRQVLESEGFTTRAAYSGDEALAQVQKKLPDLVVLDVMLPGIDGFEVCARLKMHRDTNLVPILMLTALDSREDYSRGIRVGADMYMTKPFDNRMLMKNVGRLVKQRRSDAEEGVRGKVVFTVESDLEYLDDINRLLTGLFEHTPLSEEDVHRIKYAVIEMGHNAIEWGNKHQRDRLVTLTYQIDDERVFFRIRDEGNGFDPSDVPHAANQEEPLAHMEFREKLGLREGGFGMLLCRQFMDEVHYNERGNEVTLVKRLR